MRTESKNSSSVLQTIAKPETAFYAVLGLVLFVSTPHLASSFKELNGFSEVPSQYREVFGWVVGVLFSLFLELGIMYFALKNKILITVLFMIISFVLSLQNYKTNLEAFSFESISSVLISLSIPLLICFVSHGVRLKEEVSEDNDSGAHVKQTPDPVKLQVTQEKAPAPLRTTASKNDPSKMQRIQAIVKDLQNGLTYDDITAKHKVSRGTVAEIKKKFLKEAA